MEYGQSSISSNSTIDAQFNIYTTIDTLTSKHNCYLLLNDNSRTYVGYTNNPSRRIRQHNGEIQGGAKKTIKGRPWRFALIVSGFANEHDALSFEWYWQHSYVDGRSIQQRDEQRKEEEELEDEEQEKSKKGKKEGKIRGKRRGVKWSLPERIVRLNDLIEGRFCGHRLSVYRTSITSEANIMESNTSYHLGHL